MRNIEDILAEYLYYGCKRLLSKFIKADKNYETVQDITRADIIKLKNESGIGGIILDVDGTILHSQKGVSEETSKWINMIKEELKICVVSNASRGWIKPTMDEYNLDYIAFAGKPRKKAFLQAADKMGLEPENIMVIGDELIADIVGAKRVGMKNILVKDLNEER